MFKVDVALRPVDENECKDSMLCCPVWCHLVWCIGEYVVGIIRGRQFFPSRVVYLEEGV